MRDPSARLLRLLSLLQSPREWPGTELADRLGVTTRTIRRDVERLRELGYPVQAAHGATGGYRLGSGAAMPPLLLDDDEALAIAIGLRTATAAPVTGIADICLRALAKLEQVLPARLRHRLTALSQAAVPLHQGDAPSAAPETLAALARACQVSERVRFPYAKADGRPASRLVEPRQLVAAGRRWYLVAFDLDRADWRTFRLDRIGEVLATGVRVPRRELPGGVDAATWVARSLTGGTVQARLRLHAPLEQARRLVPPWQGVLEPDPGSGRRACLLITAPDSPAYLARRISQLPVDYTLLDPPQLAPHLRTIARRAAHAIRDLPPAADPPP
ncbi:helix-turn-helix transcriptional regulator [Bailinhaonella thermotolerans]|uniref:WYL domain-containing protein n=1 Tax=Bailinhaonella thermotolerans TaxID=1070861 RepID=A0A3A4B4Y3_9ACTN|nr:WYL domain-containing protein [Bailinhaonella thermotolerans]RJL35660.1 WYL domain-containing protein [Bailinhaonella thermotolerans]